MVLIYRALINTPINDGGGDDMRELEIRERCKLSKFRWYWVEQAHR